MQFLVIQMYKDDVELVGIVAKELSVSELGTYKYEEVWTDEFEFNYSHPKP